MKVSLREYRDEILDRTLALLWRQWSALGIPGHGAESSRHYVDPEALLAFTCTFGRYDPRLFDEMLGWLASYERFINTQRVNTLFKKKLFSGSSVGGGIARFLCTQTKQKRWRNLERLGDPVAEPHSLFFLGDGRPLPVSGECDPSFSAAGFARDPVRLRQHATFRANGPGAILLRLRTLMGVSARCEILVYLMTHASGYPREIATETHYAQKTVHDALDDLALSQYVVSRRGRRKRLCRLESKDLAKALLGGHPAPTWMNWPVVLGALERAWMALDELSRLELDPLLEISEVRQISEALAETLHPQKSVSFVGRPQSNDLSGCVQPVIELLTVVEE